MCGIVGIINKDLSSVDYSLLSEMADTIRYRGPDEEGHMIEGAAGFYHKRLAIIDLESGQQPMTIGPVTLVFNGQIYNYIELRETLKKAGHSFISNSDTEVLLRSYLHFGPDCVRHFNGMFAFLIYDRAKKRIMAARDRLGIKPLYYFENDGHLIYASEIKALLAHPAVAAEPNYDSIKEYLIFQYVLNTETFFKGIHKICPGHYHLVDIESFTQKHVNYWNLDFTSDNHHTEQYFTESLMELLDDAVRLQMRSDVPLGTYLSGGLDSSTVTMLAAGKVSGPIKAFTGAFQNGPEYDETLYAREVARSCGAELFEIYPEISDFIELLPKLIHLMDEPLGGPGLFPQFMVSKLAAQEVKVVLGGQGGDEIFGGYTRYVIAYLEQALKGAIFETNDEGIHIVSLKSILPNLPVMQRYVPMLKYFWEEGIFQPMDQRYFRLINRMRDDRSILDGDFNSHFEYDRHFARFQSVFNNPVTQSYYNKMVHYDLVTNLPALLHVEDRMAMGNSLESRAPMLDHRIVEFITKIPPPMKFKGAELKYILKKTVKDLLPPLILQRKDKMGFPVPLNIWARNGMQTYYKDILISPRCRNRGIFNPDRLEKLIDREEDFGRKLWGILNIELWFRQFIDS